jgi:serine/threonine-protein kinase
MFNLLTGRLVHEGRTANEQLLFAMTKEPPPLESVLPTSTPAVCHVVNRALSFEKDRRWRDAGRMQEALRSAYYDRFGKLITTSPRLVVPESVPDRTLADSPVAVIVPRLPTTGQPVETARKNVTTVPGRPSRSQMTVVLLGGVVALVVTVTAAAWVVSALHRSAIATAGSVPAEAAAMTALPAASVTQAPLPAASSAPTASTPPVVAATDLPPAATAVTPPPHAAVTASTGTGARPIPPPARAKRDPLRPD